MNLGFKLKAKHKNGLKISNIEYSDSELEAMYV